MYKIIIIVKKYHGLEIYFCLVCIKYKKKMFITSNYGGWDKENYLLADYSEYLGTKYKLFR